jgi:hypothetical protein
LPAAVFTTCAIAGLLAAVGADARWLAALGQQIMSRASVPAGVPFAAAPTAHWPNAIVLSEIIFHVLEAALGDRGLMIAQLAAVAVAATVLARDAVAGGATTDGAGASVLLAALGAIPCLAVIRVQLFSLAFFPVLCALLRSEARRPSWRVQMVVPLLALWSNLHGAALVGLLITIIYLALGRSQCSPRSAVVLALASLAAICLTPAGIHTIAYYQNVLTNEAAQRREGLWAPLSLTAPLDILLILSVGALAIRLRRARPQTWELVALIALAWLTLKTGRSGVWLLLFLVPLSARGFRPRPLWNRLLPAVATVAVAVTILAVVRGPLPTGGTPSLIARAIAASHGTPILADDIVAERVALASGRVWIANPIDAFSKHDQIRYLDWMDGKPGTPTAISPRVHVVLTSRGSRAQRLMSGDRRFRIIASDRTGVLFTRG